MSRKWAPSQLQTHTYYFKLSDQSTINLRICAADDFGIAREPRSFPRNNNIHANIQSSLDLPGYLISPETPISRDSTVSTIILAYKILTPCGYETGVYSSASRWRDAGAVMPTKKSYSTKKSYHDTTQPKTTPAATYMSTCSYDQILTIDYQRSWKYARSQLLQLPGNFKIYKMYDCTMRI